MIIASGVGLRFVLVLGPVHLVLVTFAICLERGTFCLVEEILQKKKLQNDGFIRFCSRNQCIKLIVFFA
jgi:hypothetical protein